MSEDVANALDAVQTARDGMSDVRSAVRPLIKKIVSAAINTIVA